MTKHPLGLSVCLLYLFTYQPLSSRRSRPASPQGSKIREARRARGSGSYIGGKNKVAPVSKTDSLGTSTLPIQPRVRPHNSCCATTAYPWLTMASCFMLQFAVDVSHY